jgi:hypothetical protein
MFIKSGRGPTRSWRQVESFLFDNDRLYEMLAGSSAIMQAVLSAAGDIAISKNAFFDGVQRSCLLRNSPEGSAENIPGRSLQFSLRIR